MVTKEQAVSAQYFHYGECTVTVGPRGGREAHTEEWRRNGQTQTWKTRPDEFRAPVKYGLYAYGNITDWNADEFHVADNCQPREIRS